MKLLTVSVLLIIIFSTISYSFVMTGPDYKVNAIISGAAGNATYQGTALPNPYHIYYAAMQPVIKSQFLTDNTSVVPYRLCLGIFCTRLFEIPHYVTVRGTVYYDTGNVVADSDAKLVVTIDNAKYISDTFKTDSNGRFSTVVSVPETIMKKEGGLIKPFGVKVYVTGRIEAVYSCTFYQEGENSGNCY